MTLCQLPLLLLKVVTLLYTCPVHVASVNFKVTEYETNIWLFRKSLIRHEKHFERYSLVVHLMWIMMFV